MMMMILVEFLPIVTFMLWAVSHTWPWVNFKGGGGGGAGGGGSKI
jgi:hypothetical protein